MNKILSFFILFLFVEISSANSLNSCKKLYNSEKRKEAIQCLLKIYKSNKKDVDALFYLSNYLKWEGYSSKSELAAKFGYDLTKDLENSYPFFFYDKKTTNRLFLEYSFVSNDIYSLNSYFIESSHKYKENGDRVVFNYRKEVKVENTADFSEQIGVGILSFLDREDYLQTMIYTSPTETFLPKYSIENELFNSYGNNTVSINFKINSYSDKTSTTSLSPNLRHEFDYFYLGLKPNILMAGREPLASYKIYLGTNFTYRLQAEGGYSFGKTREDYFSQKVDFNSYDIHLLYKLTHSTSIGFKYNNYKSNLIMNQDSFYINLLWKY